MKSLLNRVTKLHQKEFEVVPEAWSKLNDVLSLLGIFVLDILLKRKIGYEIEQFEKWIEASKQMREKIILFSKKSRN